MNKRDGRTRVLFVCVGNSCRSTMAEAIALRDAADTIEPFSAGLSPLGYIAEMTKRTLMKNGYGVTGLKSKEISPEVWDQADRVVNMSGRPLELPFTDHSKVEDWPVEDPFGENPELYQQTFEKIWLRVAELIQECRRKQKAARTAEHRSSLRVNPTSPIFINPDDLNGGVVFNISEDGLAFSAGMDLSADQLLTMRIQFPGSGNWVETSGQIVWTSESRKEAGIRFVGLGAEAQRQIRNWIHEQVSEAEARAEKETSPVLSNEPDALPQSSLDELLEVDSVSATPQGRRLSDELEREEKPRPLSNRRIHFRKRVVPPSYISLENGNVGIVLNVSEGGLNLAVATALPDTHFLEIRFQIPYCSGWIEARGQIAWKSESGMEAGIRFVALTEEARGQIRKWIRSRAAPNRLQKQLEKIRRAQNLRVARLILGSRGHDEAVQEDWPAEPFVPDPVSSLEEVRIPVAAPKAQKAAVILPAKAALQTRLGAKNRRRNIKIPGPQWRRIATTAGLIVLFTLTVGWIARNLNAGNKLTVSVVRQTAAASGGSKIETRPPERRIIEAPPAPSAEEIDLLAQRGESLPDEQHQNSAAPRRNLPRQVRSVEHASPPSILKHPKPPPKKAPAPAQTAATKEPTLVAANVNTPAAQTTGQQQNVVSLPAPPPQPQPQPAANTSAVMSSVVSSNPGPPKDVSPVEPKKNESSPSSPKLPERPANVTGLVAIHTDPYPSLRIPAEQNTKKLSRGGKSLQFGHLVSRVEPPYPEDARQRGIEGTVKLHAVFGRDGTVQSVSSISGPPALVAAAMNAVRGWHYSQTLLDNKSIEIEEDISVEFRLSNSAAARN